jgi:uncharacterized protein
VRTTYPPLELLTDQRLHLVVMPTEACHLRCTYCYESFQTGRMAPEVVKGLENWIESRASGLHELTLSWFGGEPLLAQDLVLRVQQHALDLARRHPPLQVRANLTTNGHLLDRALFEELLALAIRDFQITLDGDGSVHDRTRKLSSGRGTFKRIWSHLVAMSAVSQDFRVLLRVHVHRENLDSLPRLLERCAAQWRGDGRFRLAFKPLFHPHRPGFDESLLLSSEEGTDAVEFLRLRARDLGLVEERIGDPGEATCYAARGNSFVVRSDGRLGKCSVILDSPENQVGRLLPDGTVDVDATRLEPWIRGLFTGDQEERYCPMRHVTRESRVAST